MPAPSPAPPRTRRRSAPSRWRLWLLLGPLAACLLIVAGLLALRWWVNSYLHGAGFRRMVDQQASKALHADGKLGILQWQGTEVYSDAFDSVGNADSPLAHLTAEQIRARLDLGALWRRTWRVEEVDLQRLGITLAAEHPTPDQMPPTTEVEVPPVAGEPPTRSGPDLSPGEQAPENTPVQPPPKPGFLAGWLPNRVEVGLVKIEDFSLAWNADRPESGGKLERTRLTLRPVGDDNRSWQINGTEGRLSQAHFPPVLVHSFALKTTPHELFITRVSGQVEAGGQIEISGKQELDGDRTLDLQADVDGLPLAAFLPPEWRKRLRGNAAGSVHVTGSARGDRQASGHLELRDGKLAALPMLDQLAVFTASERYRQIPLQKARADFEWVDNDVTVKNLRVESEGLLRIEGGFTVRANRLDGTLQIGVARSTLRWLSDVGTLVFDQPEHDGYVWTTVRLDGPANHPAEDLSPRLIAAVQNAALRKAQQGADTVLDTAKSLLDLLH